MDWGFLVGFSLGSALLFGYHIWWLHELCASNKQEFKDYRNDLFHMMIEFGQIEEIKMGKDDDNDMA